MPIFKIILGLATIQVLYLLLKRRPIGLLGVFILVISFLEIIVSNYFSYRFQYNHMVYSIIAYLSVLFYLISFRVPKKNRKIRITYLLSFIAWHLFAIWNLIYGEGIGTVNMRTYNLGMILTCIWVLRWLYQKLYLDHYENLFYNPKLYIGFGILIFYTCSFTILNFMEYLVISDNFKTLYLNLLQIGNIFLSLGYLGAILCQIKKTHYTIS